MSKYALVLVNIKGLGVKTFSYAIPEEMKEKLKIGQAVLVPFGRQGLINAFVVGFSDYLPAQIKAKKINKILEEKPLFSLDYLKLLEWVANYYACDFVTVLNTAIPLKLIEKGSKVELCIELIDDNIEGVTKRQREILELLKREGKCSLTNFEKKAHTTRATIKKLEKFVKISEEEVFRNPLEVFADEKIEPLYELNDEQNRVYQKVKEKKDSKFPILIHGVTASGKTEVYFKLIKDTIDEGKMYFFLPLKLLLPLK